jgi:hypothetical protein
MLARLWTTGVRPERIDDYEKFAREISLPMFRAQQGFLGCIMSHRNDGATRMRLPHWTSHLHIERRFKKSWQPICSPDNNRPKLAMFTCLTWERQ